MSFPCGLIFQRQAVSANAILLYAEITGKNRSGRSWYVRATFAYDIVAGLTSGYLGESTTISISGRTTIRVYDQAGRLAEVRDGSDITSYEYFDNGSLETQTLPNGITANYTYYDNNKLHTLANKNGSLILEAYQYAYDGAGNITAKQDIKGTTAYIYTDLNQLQSVTEPSGKLTEYTYDGAGNRLTETVTVDETATVTSYEVNEQNRLLHTERELDPGTVIENYFYDHAGNMLGRATEAYLTPTGVDAMGLAGMQDGEPYYGYSTPTTIRQRNVVIPAVWKNNSTISYLHTHPSGSTTHSGMDKVVAELTGRPYYTVTSQDYPIYYDSR